MNEFGKIKGPLTDFTCTVYNFSKFIDFGAYGRMSCRVSADREEPG